MNRLDRFINERKLIGFGAMSKVYLYNGYAYKCFSDDYPLAWINYEYKIQKEIIKSKLLVPKYYKSEFLNSIKMQLIKGKTLADYINKNNSEKTMQMFMEALADIHKIKNLNLDKLEPFFIEKIDKAPITSIQKKLAKKYIKDIEKNVDEDECLCHMDYHFLNTIIYRNRIHIIDWINARNGKPIYDYAKTYVIMYEYAPGYKHKYIKQVLKLGYDLQMFKKAVYVNAINRIEEHDSKRVRQLISFIENNKFM